MEENEIIKKEKEEGLKEFQPLFNLICLSKYPFFVRASGKDKRRALMYEGKEREKKVRWEIRSGMLLPGEPENKIWIWLCDKVMKVKKETRETPKYINYSLYEIAEYWNLSKGGSVLKNLYNALKNLVHTTITYTITDEKNGGKEEIVFLLIERILEKGSKTEEGGVLTRGIIELSDTARTMFENRLIKPNRLETLKSLADENIIASNLYQLLSYVYFITRKDIVDFWYEELSKTLGLIPQKSFSLIERQFERVKDALKTKKVIEDLLFQKVVDQQDLKTENIKCQFFIGETIKNEIKEFTKKADHQKLVEKKVEGQIEDEELEKETKYWLDEIEKEVKTKADDLKHLLQKIIKTNKNYYDLFYRAISETRMYNPENKKAYLITLLQKFSSE